MKKRIIVCDVCGRDLTEVRRYYKMSVKVSDHKFGKLAGKLHVCKSCYTNMKMFSEGDSRLSRVINGEELKYNIRNNSVYEGKDIIDRITNMQKGNRFEGYIKEATLPILTGVWEDSMISDNGKAARVRSVCSNCGNDTNLSHPPYCPNCGAKMIDVNSNLTFRVSDLEPEIDQPMGEPYNDIVG